VTDKSNIPVDDLRQKLKNLGYLQTTVGRFVLAPARHERSALHIAASASARIGALAALLLGPAAAIGIAARLPQLVTGVRDAIVVALYLAILFGLGGTAAAFLTGLAARAAARTSGRTRLVPAVASTVVSAACLVYLALWWSAVTPDPASRASLWAAGALAVALAISLILGHAVAVMTAALVALEASGPAPAGGRRRLLWGMARVAAFAGAAVLLASTTRSRDAPSVAPAFAAVPTGQRVVVFGVDGFDPALFDAFPAANRPATPALRPPAMSRIAAPPEEDPPRAWTTIATGVPPEIHGISQLELRRVAGVEGALDRSRASRLGRMIGGVTDLFRLTQPALATGVQRRQKAFWEVAAEKGFSTAVINWWATWPAAGPGIVVSERAILRFQQPGEQNGEVTPPEFYDALLRDWLTLSREARALAASHLSLVQAADVRTILTRSAELDASQIMIALHPALGKPDLLAVYLPGLDIARHALAASETGLSPSALAARAGAFLSYYIFLDWMMRRIIEPSGATWILVTHPGRVPASAPGQLAVGGAAAARITTTASFVDVAPTVLYALGLPASRTISGRPQTALFHAEFVARYPVRTVESYGSRAATPAPRSGQPLNQEMIDRLRSLGYVR
jgi:hypothetical protein